MVQVAIITFSRQRQEDCEIEMNLRDAGKLYQQERRRKKRKEGRKDKSEEERNEVRQKGGEESKVAMYTTVQLQNIANLEKKGFRDIDRLTISVRYFKL